LVGESLSDPTLNAFNIDNLILNNNVEDHFSTKEDLKNDGDEDDGGGDDIEDDLIRGLMTFELFLYFYKFFYFKNLCFVLYDCSSLLF